jgi:hypothetical protein
MKLKLRYWIFCGALGMALLSAARSVSASSAYQAYLAGRSSGAVLFSIVQAFGMQASRCEPPHHIPARLSCTRCRR